MTENKPIPKALYITRFCNFGNNMVQFYNALKFAREMGVPKIYIKGLGAPYIFNPSFKRITVLGNIEVINERPPIKMQLVKYQKSVFTPEGVLVDKFFRGKEHGGYPFIQVYDDAPLIWDAIRQVMQPPPSCISKELYVHIRSGNIFRRPKPKQNYVQPPLSFYQMAIADQIERHKPKGIKIVFQDKSNFMIDPLVAHCKRLGLPVSVHSNPSNAVADITELLKAKCSVIGKGTWMPVISCIAGAVREISCFRLLDCAYLFKNSKTNIRIYEDADGGYIKNWRIRPGNFPDSNAQIQQLLHYPIQQIRLKEDAN